MPEEGWAMTDRELWILNRMRPRTGLRRSQIIGAIENGHSTASAIAKHLRVSYRTVLKDLKQLSALGIVKHTGSTTAGKTWKLLREEG